MFAALGLRQYLMIGGGIALVLFAAWAWRVNDLRGHYKALAASEKAAHEQTVANYTNAQKAAQALFDAKIKAAQLRNKELNDEADRRVADLSAKHHDSIMRLPKAVACHPSGPGVPEAGISESTDRPGDSAGLSDRVIITRKGAAQCAVVTSRLQAAHDWALEIMETE